jgi:predicted CoA-substrate-specific enzyme activase
MLRIRVCSGRKNICHGYGRVIFDQAGKTITEIKCHARGIAELYPGVRTIIDIGGQDSKVISIGPKGQVVDFAMNDKCAAGTGRFLQVMATALGLDVSELGDNEDPSRIHMISSMCTVFAESEIIGLLARGNPKGGIIAGLHQSVGRRVAAMARRMGIKEQVAFTGGVALNPGLQRALEEEIGTEIIVPEACQYTGALGAALLALEN